MYMVGFCSLLPISFDAALLLLLTFPRFVKSSTSSYIDVIVHLISLRLLPTVFLMIQSIATRNSNGDMMRPCLSPLVMLNQLLNLLSSITLHGKLSQKALKISLPGHSYAESIFHRLSRCTLSNALSNSIKFSCSLLFVRCIAP